MTTLREEIERLAEEAFPAKEDYWGQRKLACESAVLAGITLVLDREPSEEMYIAGDEISCRSGIDKPGIYVGRIYRAMTAQLLKELE